MIGVFSVSPAEILTIALVALIVFGPGRLPELSRKAGKVLREVRDSAQELRAGIEREAGGSLDLADVRREMHATLSEFATPPDKPTSAGGPGETPPSAEAP